MRLRVLAVALTALVLPAHAADTLPDRATFERCDAVPQWLIKSEGSQFRFLARAEAVKQRDGTYEVGALEPVSSVMAYAPEPDQPERVDGMGNTWRPGGIQAGNVTLGGNGNASTQNDRACWRLGT